MASVFGVRTPNGATCCSGVRRPVGTRATVSSRRSAETGDGHMEKRVEPDRRQFLGAVAMTTIPLGAMHGASPPLGRALAGQQRQGAPAAAFSEVKQVDAGVLNVGYAEVGPVNGPAV